MNFKLIDRKDIALRYYQECFVPELDVNSLARLDPMDKVGGVTQRQRRNTTENRSAIYYFAGVGKIGQNITGGRKSVV